MNKEFKELKDSIGRALLMFVDPDHNWENVHLEEWYDDALGDAFVPLANALNEAHNFEGRFNQYDRIMDKLRDRDGLRFIPIPKWEDLVKLLVGWNATKAGIPEDNVGANEYLQRYYDNIMVLLKVRAGIA